MVSEHVYFVRNLKIYPNVDAAVIHVIDCKYLQTAFIWLLSLHCGLQTQMYSDIRVTMARCFTTCRHYSNVGFVVDNPGIWWKWPYLDVKFHSIAELWRHQMTLAVYLWSLIKYVLVVFFSNSVKRFYKLYNSIQRIL